MRSADIASRCREIALRVDASGEWGELGDTLRLAATEIERLRRAVESWERESQAHAAEAERLRMVIPNASEANAMLVAAQHIEAYLGRPSDQSILLRDLCKRVREIQ